MYTDTISIFEDIDTDEGSKVIQYIISGVYFEASIGATLDKDGERKSYNATVIIPERYKCSEGYMRPRAWERLSFEEKLDNFTLHDGQVVALIDHVIQCGSINDIINEYDDVYRVIGVEHYRGVLPHFEVLCK